MADLAFTITDAGRAAIVAAGTAGTLPVTIATLGVSPTALTPTASVTSLPGEVKRIAAVSGNSVAADTIHLTVSDSSSDTYVVQSMALYLASGTLFAIYGQSTPILSKASDALLLIAADIKFADISASSITFGNTDFLLPPATETVKGVAEIATQAESDAGTDDLRIVTPKKNRSSFLTWVAAQFADVWRSSNDGSGSGLDADLLDGQHGSYYASIPARLGFTPINKGGDVSVGSLQMDGTLDVRSPGSGTTGGVRIRGSGSSAFMQITDSNASSQWGFWQYGSSGSADWNGGALTRGGSRVWDASNDGAGSGLDADLLDGTDWTGGQHVSFGYVDSTGSFRNNNAPWGPDNDGSGSGLDADLLDGHHASDFVFAAGAGNIRAAADMVPASGVVNYSLNVSSVTFFGSRIGVAYTTPITHPVPVVMGGDSTNSSSSQSAFWGSGSSNTTTGFSANFGVAGGGGTITKASFITCGV